jgi:hypothetical protein
MYRALEQETSGVANNDSFINEVTEEVRRDRLFALFRRYGWIALLVVVALVGGAAWNEWRKAQERAEAQARGDALLAALESQDPAARGAALEALRSGGPAEPVVALLAATQSLSGEGAAAAVASLTALAGDPAVPPLYRDLATLKAAMLGAGEVAPDDRIAALEPLSAPGGAFRPLALEQIALAHAEAGRTAEALAVLTDLFGAADVSVALRERAGQMILALGGSLDAT